MNKAMLMGNLGKNAEVRQTKGGKSVMNFSIATTEKWDGGEHTEWSRCVMWGDHVAKLAPYLTKGTRILVEGSLRTSKWTDKDNNDRETKEINVSNIEFCERKQTTSVQPVDNVVSSAVDDDDVPF